MPSMPTVRGNGPNFTFLTILLLVHLSAVFLSVRAAHPFTAGERLRLWTVYIALISAAFTGRYLLPHHPNYTSHKGSTAGWSGAQHKMGRGETSEPALFYSHCTLLQWLMFPIRSTISPYATLPYHHLWLPNGLYPENLTHSVLRVVWTVIKNQSSMTIAELILQRIQDEQELGICELKNYFSQDWVFLIFF